MGPTGPPGEVLGVAVAVLAVRKGEGVGGRDGRVAGPGVVRDTSGVDGVHEVAGPPTDPGHGPDGLAPRVVEARPEGPVHGGPEEAEAGTGEARRPQPGPAGAQVDDVDTPTRPGALPQGRVALGAVGEPALPREEGEGVAHGRTGSTVRTPEVAGPPMDTRDDGTGRPGHRRRTPGVEGGATVADQGRHGPPLQAHEENSRPLLCHRPRLQARPPGRRGQGYVGRSFGVGQPPTACRRLVATNAPHTLGPHTPGSRVGGSWVLDLEGPPSSLLPFVVKSRVESAKEVLGKSLPSLQKTRSLFETSSSKVTKTRPTRPPPWEGLSDPTTNHPCNRTDWNLRTPSPVSSPLVLTRIPSYPVTTLVVRART